MEPEGKIIRAAALFATLLGTFKVLGILSGIWIFTELAQTFGISPAPSPFSRVSFSDPNGMNASRSFGCEDSTGQVTWHRWDYRVRGALPGPHRRIVTYLSYFSSLSKIGSSGLDGHRAEIQTQYYFCHGGSLAQAAGCPADLAAVLISNGSALSQTDALRVECSK